MRVEKRIFLYLNLLLALCMAIKPDLPEHLLKIPQLIRHFQHHNLEEGENLSFLAFIKLHYFENSAHKNAEDHSSLPLFNHSEKYCNPLIIIKPLVSLLPAELLLISHQMSALYISNYHYISGKGIFQPPKV